MKPGIKPRTIILISSLACFFVVVSQFFLSQLVNLTATPKISGLHIIKTDTLNLYDSNRTRLIPVLLYYENMKQDKDLKLVVLTPGHGIKNSEYAYISRNLAMQGYVVASVQYELPQDEEINGTRNAEALHPGWEYHVKSILYVLQYLKSKHPHLDCQNLTLIGHSMGGDIVLLFAQENPEMVRKVISLDNGHMPLLRTKKPQIFSLRAITTHPDPGVLPTPGEQEEYHMQIVTLKDVTHMDMCFGTARQKEEINRYITEFLNDSLIAQ